MKLDWRKYRMFDHNTGVSVREARTGVWFMHAYPDGRWCVGRFMHWPARLQGQAGPDIVLAMEAAEEWLLGRLRSWGETGVKPADFDTLYLSRGAFNEFHRRGRP